MSYEYATFGQRAIAYIIDSIILLILSIPFFFLIRDGNITFDQATLLPRLIITVIYNTYLISHGGQTLGKKLMKIKVLTTDGYAISGNKAFLREFLGKNVMGMLVVGYFWIFFDNKKQCWQDKIAQTIVVRLR